MPKINAHPRSQVTSRQGTEENRETEVWNKKYRQKFDEVFPKSQNISDFVPNLLKLFGREYEKPVEGIIEILLYNTFIILSGCNKGK